MITMTAIDINGEAGTGSRDHFLVAFSRPGRIEFSVEADGSLLVHVYEGADIDLDQSPLLSFHSTDTDLEPGEVLSA